MKIRIEFSNNNAQDTFAIEKSYPDMGFVGSDNNAYYLGRNMADVCIAGMVVPELFLAGFVARHEQIAKCETQVKAIDLSNIRNTKPAERQHPTGPGREG